MVLVRGFQAATANADATLLDLTYRHGLAAASKRAFPGTVPQNKVSMIHSEIWAAERATQDCVPPVLGNGPDGIAIVLPLSPSARRWAEFGGLQGGSASHRAMVSRHDKLNLAEAGRSSCE
jgi:hypothetical protein